MKILDLIVLSLQGVMPDAMTGPTREERDRAMVAGRSHGNLRMQFGEFFVRADVDAKFRRYSQKGFWQEA